MAETSGVVEVSSLRVSSRAGWSGRGHRTPATTEAQVCRLRQERKLGPARIGPILDLPASTTHRILVHHWLNRLAFLDHRTDHPLLRT
ncbi:hypothetical protein ABZ038_12750 [Streptomyces sp. NPDC006349]|uniref:hypothetical protein n=1 Tax=Streptomyces sp. NPDC006349 TaxID=3156757 RepID=UPI000B229904